MSFLDEAIYERDDREGSIERQLFGEDQDVDENEKENAVDDGKEKVEAKKVKRRISTQPRLNPDKLMSDRGIKAIPDEFSDIQFKGKVIG